MRLKSGWKGSIKKSYSNSRLLEGGGVALDHAKDISSNYLATYYNNKLGHYNSKSIEGTLNRAAKAVLNRKKSQDNAKSLLKRIQGQPSRQQNELLVSAISGKKEYVNINISIGPKKTEILNGSKVSRLKVQPTKEKPSRAKQEHMPTFIEDIRNNFTRPQTTKHPHEELLVGRLSVEKNTLNRKSSAAHYGLAGGQGHQPSLVKSRSMKSIPAKMTGFEDLPDQFKPRRKDREKSPEGENSKKKSKPTEHKSKISEQFHAVLPVDVRSSRKKAKTSKLSAPFDEREVLESTALKHRQTEAGYLREPNTVKNKPRKHKTEKNIIAGKLRSVRRKSQ